MSATENAKFVTETNKEKKVDIEKTPVFTENNTQCRVNTLPDVDVNLVEFVSIINLFLILGVPTPNVW